MKWVATEEETGWRGQCANCERLSEASLGPLMLATAPQLTPQPGPPAVLWSPLRQLKGVQGRGRGSRQRWSHTLGWRSGPRCPPSPRLDTILGGVDPAPTSDRALALQAAGGVSVHLGSGPLTRLQPCRAARCPMPTQPPPSTNLPTRAAWVSSASEKVWHRLHSLASHPHRLKFWADLPTVLASTPLRA